MTNAANLANNQTFYNDKYAQASADALVAAAHDLPAVFARITSRTGSYAALYQDGLQHRLGGKNVFEIGAGRGLNALLMASFGADVVTNDISSESARVIRAAADRLGMDNLHAVTGEFLQLDLPERHFDLVVGKGFLHHLTHEQERDYLRKIARLLTPEGEARFTEPARNAPLLSRVRLMFPDGDRPSALARETYRTWKATDRHPERDNDTAHFREATERWFADVRIVPSGMGERLARLRPGRGRWRGRPDPAWAPGWLRSRLARRQLIVCRRPRE